MPINRIINCQTQDNIGKEVKVAGWVNIRRDHGQIIFIDLRDRSGILQVVCQASLVEGVKDEDVLEIEGLVKERPSRMVNPNLITGKVELEAKEVRVLARAQTLPFTLKDLNVSLPVLLDWRALTLRNEKIKNVFKVQEALADEFRKSARELDCTEIFVPTISASATEGGAEVFKVDYYSHPAYLTQSPQLYKQMMVPVFERVYTISHAYRSEPSVTTRHLSESIQLDCEFGFADFKELLDLMEKVGTNMFKAAESECPLILKEYGAEKISYGEIPRLTLRAAQEIIYREEGRDVRKEKDLSPEDEIDICKWALKEKGSDFVTITHFPTQKRAFYTMPDPENPVFSLSYDLLFRGMEICSGSQRINNYDQLVSTIKERGMNPGDFEMYLQSFKFGMPPEGGFSFGLERMTKNILNLGNVREASLFPRDMERIDLKLAELKKKEEEKPKKKKSISQKK
ncbi:MAG: aspartate--tRNA(Asn) ligase [Candidatus Pacebacteria bacterium]|nr:aspartate--tRNA(Asn) ligase [Candidatus Paceibacterota bacterium]